MTKGYKPCVRCGGTGQVPDPIYHGQKAREARLKADVPLRELARRMGFSVAYLSDLELGRRDWGSKIQKKYAEALKQEMNGSN